jgi:hypothetical protein
MTKYRNEMAFSRALVVHLKNKGYQVTRIETGKTTRGVPDLYVASIHGCMWIELKRIHTEFSRESYTEIPWRPGQLGWMLNHLRSSGFPCFTFVAFDDCIVCIPITKVFKGNRIFLSDVSRIWYSIGKVDIS